MDPIDFKVTTGWGGEWKAGPTIVIPKPEIDWPTMRVKDGKTKCFQCRTLVLLEDAYRCFYCKHYFCTGCAERHFIRDKRRNKDGNNR